MNKQEHLTSEEHQTTLLKYLIERRSHFIDDRINQEVTSSRTTMCTNAINDASINISVKDLHEMIEQVEGSVKVLMDDTRQLSSESNVYRSTTQSLYDELSRLKLSIQETNALLNGHKSNQHTLAEQLTSLQQDVNDLKNTSYDGTFIWKISDFRQKTGIIV